MAQGTQFSIQTSHGLLTTWDSRIMVDPASKLKKGGPMRASILAVVLAGIVLGFAADTSRLSSQTSEPARNDNDVFAAVARAAPGFAGVYFDASGETLHILIKDATEDRRDAAQSAVESLLAGDRRSASMRVEFGPARYDFLELKEQYDHLTLLSWPSQV